MTSETVTIPVLRRATLIAVNPPIPVKVLQEAPQPGTYAMVITEDGKIGNVMPEFLR